MTTKTVPFFEYPRLWKDDRDDFLSIIDNVSSSGGFILQQAVFDFENEPDVVNAQCPAPHGNVHFQVRREKLPKVEISKGVKKKVKIFIRITSIDDKAENCCCNQKVGAEYEFNQGDLLEQMCPAALYNIYPTIKAVTGHGKERWTKNGKTFVQCPDNFSKLKFEIETKKNKNLK